MSLFSRVAPSSGPNLPLDNELLSAPCLTRAANAARYSIGVTRGFLGVVLSSCSLPGITPLKSGALVQTLLKILHCDSGAHQRAAHLGKR